MKAYSALTEAQRRKVRARTKRWRDRHNYKVSHGNRILSKESRHKNTTWKNKEYWRRRALLNQIKNAPCTDCGHRFPSCAMDFDHRDKNTKLMNIGSSLSNKSWEAVLTEIAKCDLVCANCHRIRTYVRNV